MAKGNSAGLGTAGTTSVSSEDARQNNQQAMQRAAQKAGQTNFEFGSQAGATGATGATGAAGATGAPSVSAGDARQNNQRAMQGAASKSGQNSR